MTLQSFTDACSVQVDENRQECVTGEYGDIQWHHSKTMYKQLRPVMGKKYL
ncbi:hypothetical protein BWQ96_02946 [Gracilariopsis chorda]|uniref:Uncharacterized protein n=1 Tax=Gracilariopsis chorda TaxID=448386 RepID=A0A2V3IZ53_9FLOR|nr:hypothetical protein BWQ96_02946 [Gracilariopsis chorda]|eukprot:PXF47333.1 hypothetical protein BWQ96_02946 [Gracilariopsis chorda]